MTVKIIFISITLDVAWRGVEGSVAGITYMDDFDFQPYHRVHECDPFYWHPLHMPEECADIYEKLIRSRLPVRVAMRKTSGYRPKFPMQAYEPFQYSEYPLYSSESVSEESEEIEESRELTPYEEMMEAVQEDVNDFPSVPAVRVMPNLGPVAVYQQPVSRVSADIIKKVALTYVQSEDDKDRKKGKKGDRGKKRGKSRGKWKDLINKVRSQHQKGWKKINNGDIVTYSNS